MSKAVVKKAVEAKTEKKSARKPLVQRMQAAVERAEKILDRAAKRFEAVDAHTDNKEIATSQAEVKKLLATVLASLPVVQGHLNDLPADLKTSTRAHLEVGSVVSLRENRRAEYEKLLDKKDLDNLKVAAINGGRVKLTTEHGTAIVVSRNHVTLNAA